MDPFSSALRGCIRFEVTGTFQLVERELEQELLTSSRASMKDNTSSGAFLISSIILGSVATTIHSSKSGILNILFGHWEKSLNIACKR